MRVRKAIQKIAAFGTGMSLVGATLMGAMAADLGDYPSPFVKDGQFDAVIVVGDKAAAEDVVGAVDIGASLQFALATPAAAVGGAGGVLQGDVVEIGEPSDMLEVNERIGNVRETLTDAFLDALRSGIVTTDEGTTDYNQYLRFANQSYTINPGNASNVGNIPSGRVVFQEDEDDVVGHYLFFKDSDTIFEYELEFEEGVESEIKFKSGTSGARELDDLEDEQVVVLGETYTIVDTLFAEGIGTTTQRVKLELLGGDVVDTLEEGECKTYNIDGVDYETCVIIISDNKNSNEGTVKFSVNGEITDEMEDGDTEVLRDGTQIGIRDILPNEAEEVSGGDIVEFFLGANEIEFEDTNATDTNFNAGGVKVGQEDIEDGAVAIVGTNTSADLYRISTIKYRLRADSLKGDVFVRPGHGLREFLDEPQGMLNNNWDIVYNGLQDTGVSIIKIDASGDDSYNLKFTSREGLDYNVPLFDNSNDASRGFTYGDEDDPLYFRECAANALIATLGLSTTAINQHYAPFCIEEDNLFVLTDDNDETGLTHVLSYESVDTSNQKLTFTDLGTGQREITYDTTRTGFFTNSSAVSMNGTTAATSGGQGSIVVGGNTFTVLVANANGNNSLAIDLNANGNVSQGDEVFVVVDGGGMLDLGTQCTNGIVGNGTGKPTSVNSANLTTPLGQGTLEVYDSDNEGGCSAPLDSVTMQLITLNQEFDENGPNNLGRNENISINVSTRTGNELDLEVLNRFQAASGTQIDTRGSPTAASLVGVGTEGFAAYEYEVLKMQSLQDEDIRQGLTTYGVFFEQSNSDNSDDADELTIEYPLFQRGVVVYITAGKVSSSAVGGEGSLVTLSQINYGSAKLASEVAGQEFKQNMILVGGPCINAAAAKLMGSSEPLCGERSGIKPGEAIIKLFENDGYVSLLVAGYEAADTRRATKVLSQYNMYANDLVGDEVVIKGTSMTDIKVMQPV